MMRKLILICVVVGLLFAVGTAQAATVITDAAGLQAIADDLAGDYVLGADIDLTGFDWVGIGHTGQDRFTGTFDGNYHIIDGLTATDTGGDIYKHCSLFGVVDANGVVKNVGLTNANVSAGWYCAALVGDVYGEVTNCFAINGTVSVAGDCGNTGTLIGMIREGGSVSNCYSTLDMILGESTTWPATHGGLIGYVAGTLTNCYYAGSITGTQEALQALGPGACLYGNGEDTLITSCYFDKEVVGVENDDYGRGRTTAEMMQESTYVGWDFANVWSIDEGQGYPQLPLPTVGPVGYWKLDETSGATAQDSSGNGYDGILSADPDPAPVWTTDPGRGNVLEFVPGLDYVDCGPGVGAGQNLTVALWINPADIELMRPISCFDGDDYSAGPGWLLMLRHDDWDGQVPPNVWFRMTGEDPNDPNDDWNYGDLWINECWAPGEWVHMAFTFDEDTDTLSGYINGEPAGVTVVPENRGVASDTNPLIMGHGGGSEQYEGLMDEVCIYDIVLTDAEIWNLVYPIAIPVPNGDFEEIYKPGSDTITADLGDGWTNGVGPNTPMDGAQIATYSDETTGTSVDVPGWINTPGWPTSYDWPVGCGSIAGQIVTPDGLYYYTVNGGDWGNGQGGTIVSDAPVATVGSGLTYTLSMLATGPDGPATPVVLELLADGVALTPTSSVDPNLSGDWQELSRTYDSASLVDHLGESLTIRLGVGSEAIGGQSCFDAVSLSYVPEPVEPTMVPITIDNPGFEDPVLVEDDYTWGDVPGWTLVGGEATGIEGSGIWHVTSADFDPVVAPEGQNVLFTEYLPEGIAKGVAQVLTETFAANMDYTLTVEVGNSNYYYNGGYSVQLLAGGVVIAEDNDTLWPDYMMWATSTVAYTYDPADAALVGQPLEIRLLNLALDKDNPSGDVVGVEFDNIRLYRPELTVEVLFVDDFESYAAGDALHGVGGWAGWGGDAAWGAPVSDAFASSGLNSVEVIGSADLVQEFDLAGGMLELSAMQYIPSGTTGTTYFILLNQYGETNDWSVQTSFDLAAGTLTFWNGETATILYDQWVELKCVIDLDNNTVDEYYNGELIATRQWDDNEHGTLGAIDLYSEGASSIYYDDITVSRP